MVSPLGGQWLSGITPSLQFLLSSVIRNFRHWVMFLNCSMSTSAISSSLEKLSFLRFSASPRQRESRRSTVSSSSSYSLQRRSVVIPPSLKVHSIRTVSLDEHRGYPDRRFLSLQQLFYFLSINYGLMYKVYWTTLDLFL